MWVGHARALTRTPKLTPLRLAMRFSAPLKTSLLEARGAPATFARASTATVTDHEGVIRPCLPGEARFQGLRRVRNLLGYSQCDSGFVAAGTTPPTVSSSQQYAGESCTAVTFTSAMSIGYAGCRAERTGLGVPGEASVTAGVTYIQSNYVGLSRALTGTEKIDVYWTGASGVIAYSLTSANSAALVGALVRLAPAATAGGGTGQNYPVIYLTGALSSNVTVYTNKCMFEEVTYQAVQTPGEYVPTNTGGPYFGPNTAPSIAAGAAWSNAQTGWSVSAGQATVNSAAAGSTYLRDGACIAGASYLVTYTLSAITGNGITASAGGSIGTLRTAPGTYSEIVVAGGTAGTGVYASGSNTVGTVTNVTVVQCLFSGAGVDGVKYFDTKLDGTPIAQYGPELVTNGDFSNGSGWAFNGASPGWSVSGGAAVVTATAGGNRWLANNTNNLVVGKTYKVTADVVVTAGQVALDIGGANTFVTASGPAGWVQTATLTYPNFMAASNFIGSIDNVSFREILTAPKGYLNEPARTQQLANTDDLSAAPWGGSGIAATDDGKRYRGRVFWKLTKTTASANEVRSQSTPPLTGYYTNSLALCASANSSQLEFGLFGGTSGWGTAGNTTCKIDSGPGTVSQQVGGLWRVTGLSTSMPTVVSITRNYSATEIIGLYLYPDTSVSTTVGNAVYVQVDNVEAGNTKSSYMPNPNASGTVTRAADSAIYPVTMAAAAGTLAVTFTPPGSDTGATWPGIRLWDGSGNSINLFFDPAFSIYGINFTAGGVNQVNTGLGGAAPVAGVSARLKVSWGGGRIAYCINGGAVTVLTGKTMPAALTQFSSANMSGTITDVNIYNTAVPDSTLQAL
jgi:hypothetical protein